VLAATLPPQPLRRKASWLARPIWKCLTPAILILIAIMLLSVLLHFYRIGDIGDSNAYYTAAVKSMLMSWKNLFFNAAEPGGSVTVDKPPLGLWIEAAFAAVLGVSGLSVSLPNILAGLLGILLLYSMVKKSVGELAGLVAALVMATSPIFVATNRNNTQDGLLVFFLLMAAWAFVQATETGKRRWLLLGGFIVGLGFNIKMLQALLPLPAFYALYFFGCKEGWLRKGINLVIATVLLVAVSLSWAVVVDSVPAGQRPYIGSSESNTVMGLLFGHNGMARLGIGGEPGGGAPQSGAPPPSAPPVPQAGSNPNQGIQPQQGALQNPPWQAVVACANAAEGASCSFISQNGNTIEGFCIRPPNSNALACAPRGTIPQDGPVPLGGPAKPAGGSPVSQETGVPGAFRFFMNPLSKQMSWLLPFALISVLLALFASPRIRLPIESGVHKALVIWGGWLLTCLVFFSMISGIFHAYYAIMLVPGLGAMVGIGFAQLWSLSSEKKWAGILLAVSAALTIAFQYVAAAQYGETSSWLLGGGILLGLGVLATGVQRQLAYATILAAMMVIPVYWTVMTVASSENANLPTAYTPRGQQRPGVDRPLQQPIATGNAALTAYLEANTRDVEYLVAVPSSQQQGARLVLATGRPVLYIGGFGGQDAVVSAADLRAMIASGELRYVYYGGDRGRNEAITRWLQSSCSVVPEFSRVGSGDPSSAVQVPIGQQAQGDQAMSLYMCK
jgi:4-amino-4-deoxy-L-arabinose transferase-like glycosyltransferase